MFEYVNEDISDPEQAIRFRDRSVQEARVHSIISGGNTNELMVLVNHCRDVDRCRLSLDICTMEFDITPQGVTDIRNEM